MDLGDFFFWKHKTLSSGDTQKQLLAGSSWAGGSPCWTTSGLRRAAAWLPSSWAGSAPPPPSARGTLRPSLPGEGVGEEAPLPPAGGASEEQAHRSAAEGRRAGSTHQEKKEVARDLLRFGLISKFTILSTQTKMREFKNIVSC